MIELPNEDGNIKKVKISRAKFDELKKAGHIEQLITVHVLCPSRGYYTEGQRFEDIGAEIYEKFRDKNGDLFAIIYFDNGESKSAYLLKELWDNLKKVENNTKEAVDKLLESTITELD